jgi:hypothetical protein
MRDTARRPIATMVIVGGLTLLVIFATGLVVFADDWISLLYDVHPPTPHYPRPQDVADAQRDDLNYLRNITWLDWSYTKQTRSTANAVVDRALSEVPMSPAAFELVVARVLATANNGHTNVWGSSTANRFNRLPIRVYNFADGIFVVRALPTVKSLLGARIRAVEGTPVESVRARLREYTGGTENEKNARIPFYLESPELMHAAGLAKAPGSIVLTVDNAEGEEETISVDALPAAPSAAKIWPSDELEPVPLPGEGPAWIPALKGGADSLAMFANAPHAFFAGRLPGTTSYYVRLDTNDDDNGIRIKKFASEALRALLAQRPSAVIVDLRKNGGGDYTLTAPFMQRLPAELPNATVFVLMSQETFSAGMTDAAFLKQAGGRRVIFVGDWPGDRIRFHSEGSDFCLPYSRICMTARTALHDYSTRWCRPFFECFLLDRLYPVAIRTFAPDIYAPLTYASLSRGHDPAVDAIIRIVERCRRDPGVGCDNERVL